MDWLATNWPIVVVLMGLAAAWGRAMGQIADIRSKLSESAEELARLKDLEQARREKLQAELEAIRIALTEIKAQLGIRPLGHRVTDP